MTRVKHPDNRYTRLILKTKKDLLKNNEKKKSKEEQDNRIWRKLNREFIKRKETEDDLRQVYNGPDKSILG